MGYSDEETGPAPGLFDRLPKRLGPEPASKIQRFINSIKLESTYNYLVAIDRFEADQAPLIRSIAQELPGVSVMNQFDYLVNNTAFLDTPIVLKTDVSREIAMALEANPLKLPGVHLDDSALIRTYPGGPVMAHILGYVGKINQEELDSDENKTSAGNPLYDHEDIIGKNGIELTQEYVLRGQKGGRFIEVDGMGFEQRQLSENPAVAGRNIKLTIDLELQALATKALEEGLKFANEDRVAADIFNDIEPGEYTAGSGAVVVMDPRTGEVISLVSFPTYENELFVGGISFRKYKEYTDNPHKPLTNHAYANQFPPGSTLKLFTALAGLHEGTLKGDTTYTCSGGIYVPYSWDETQGQRYLCWQHKDDIGHGEQDLVGALTRSCDVYFYNVGTPKQDIGNGDFLHYRDYLYASEQFGESHYFEGLGIEKIHDNLKNRFWFGDRTQIELPYEATGIVPNAEYKRETFGEEDGWSAGDTINTSIGQGFFEASPLQIALNTSVIANGGTVFQPRLLFELVGDHQEKQMTFETKKLRDVKIKSDHLELVRQGMWNVCNDPEGGTAHHANDRETGEEVSKWLLTNPDGEEQIVIAGKTGTAEVGMKLEDGTYAQSHAWFTCYAPFDNPEVVITVFLNEGGEGSSYAVPIADRVMRAYFETTGRRPRGKALRKDKQPIGDLYPAPDPNDEPESDSATPEAGDGTTI
jgi:penicillin-binding protein 2